MPKIQQKINQLGKKMPFPKPFKPMLATLVDQVPSHGEWLFEIKWDGYRAIAFCNQSDVEIISRNNKSFNKKFYPVTAALENLELKVVLDGEIVVINHEGVARFSDLQNWRSEADGELIYYVFDLLWLEGYSLLDLPLSKRKELLKNLLPKAGIIRESQNLDVSLSDLLEVAKKMGLEGIIAKEAESLYQPEIRSRKWLKIKSQKKHEVVIGGYTLNKNSQKLFSALLVGVYENGILHYTGKIGTGFSRKIQEELLAKFKKITKKKCPFQAVPDINKPSRFRPNPPEATAVWLAPKLVCEVSYTEKTPDGVMRHPSFEGMREDKNAKEVEEEKSIPLSKIENSIDLRLKAPKKREHRSLLNPNEETQVKTINNESLKFNHLNKVFWPEEGYTKRDLLNYYYQIAPYILPYLKNRPQSLNRFPNGINGLSFYQKDVSKSAPEWMEQFPYRTSLGEDKNYLVVQNERDILWMVNLGAIEMNPWNSTVQAPDNPSWCMIDIDPSEANRFDQVIEVAQATKQVLDHLKIKGYCKTSGATGLHIYIPMAAQYTYDQCQLFGRMVATQVHQILPEFTSIERFNVKRKGKVYIDFLQNRPKATLAAAYSVRPKPGATVSMPLHWDEVKKGLHPSQFTLKNAIERLKEFGDLFKPVLGKGINLKKILKEFSQS